MKTEHIDPVFEHLLKVAYGDHLVGAANAPVPADVPDFDQYSHDRETVALGAALLAAGGRADSELTKRLESAVLDQNTDPTVMRDLASKVELSLGDIIMEAQEYDDSDLEQEFDELEMTGNTKSASAFYLLGAGLGNIGGLARMLLSGVAITGATAGAGAWKLERDVARGSSGNQALRYQAQMYEDLARKFESKIPQPTTHEEEEDEYAVR